MCDPDVHAQHFLLDRVVNVRPETGVPIGTRGTIVGIMYGRTNLDTYYEILFDHLPANTLDTILLGKNQQTCRVKVRSYHLLNYSHSLRCRSMNYQQQSVSANYVYDRHSYNQSAATRPQHVDNTRQGSNNSTTQKLPKSAPALPVQERPNFDQVREQKSMTDDPSPTVSLRQQPLQTSSSSITDDSFMPVPTENTPDSNLSTTSLNTALPAATFLSSYDSTQQRSSLLSTAIQNAEQLFERASPVLVQSQTTFISSDQGGWPEPPQILHSSCKIIHHFCFY